MFFFQFNYDYKAKFMNIGPSGKVKGRMENILMYMDASIDLHEMKLLLQKFEIQSAG